MLKLISMHKRDSKKIAKSDFVTSCLSFRGLIPIVFYLLIRWITCLGHRDNFPIVSVLVYVMHTE